MRRPSRQLVFASIFATFVGILVSWAVMIWLDAELRFYGYGFFILMALLVAALIVFVFDGPLNLRAFDWPSPDDEKEVMDDNYRHFSIVIVLILIIGGATSLWLNSADLLPIAASAESIALDSLMSLHFIVIGFLFALVSVFMMYSVIVFRRKEGDTEDGAYIHGHTSLEIVWTIVPLIMVLYFGYLGQQSFYEVTTPRPDLMVVDVKAFQWSWSFSYPEYDDKVSSQLFLPVDRQIQLRMESQDVIHSFWVPEFRVKQDILPHRKTTLLVTPNRLGEYKLLCAEMCGLSHADMRAGVVVMEADEFEAWATDTSSAPDISTPEGRGAVLSQNFACQGCHSLDGTTLAGPTWQGLYGKQEALDDGSTVTVDDDYLRESIVDPGAKIVSGFANVMPANFGDQLSDEELEELILYIKSVSE